MGWSQQRVEFKEYPKCWGDKTHVWQSGVPTVIPCDALALYPLGLCKRHAKEILVDQPVGDAIRDDDESPWIGLVRSLGFALGSSSPPTPAAVRS
jgi:hypothetical protein